MILGVDRVDLGVLPEYPDRDCVDSDRRVQLQGGARAQAGAEHAAVGPLQGLRAQRVGARTPRSHREEGTGRTTGGGQQAGPEKTREALQQALGGLMTSLFEG